MALVTPLFAVLSKGRLTGGHAEVQRPLSAGRKATGQ
jgi:hypothetical protein